MIERIKELINDNESDSTIVEYLGSLNNYQILEVLKNFYYEVEDLNIKIEKLEDEVTDLEYKVEDSVTIDNVMYLKGEVEDKIRFDKFSQDDMEEILRVIEWVL